MTDPDNPREARFWLPAAGATKQLKTPAPDWLIPATFGVTVLQGWFFAIVFPLIPVHQYSATPNNIAPILLVLLSPATAFAAAFSLIYGRAAHRAIAALALLVLIGELAWVIILFINFATTPLAWDF